ncbi:MAG: UDP-4-amino-4,6-dideoxy-N-acetyl-beta-L-altrosamine transaminase [Acidobacteriota bacterium]
MACNGGAPVRSTWLPYGRQSIDQDDIDAVVSVLSSELLTTGPKVVEFEEAFAAAVGARFALTTSSGTAALHAAVFAAGIEPLTEVVTTPLTFAATANCIRYQGGAVVFADVRRDTLNLDPQLVEKRITPKTRAIITVDYAGNPSDLSELQEIAQTHQLLLIEDACHALGATYKKHSIGSLADLTVFSLHPVKHITTGEGGVVTTNDAKLANRLRIFRTHGITSDHSERTQAWSWLYDMVELGFNYRLTDFQCALGLSQLKKLPGWLARRREIAAAYTEAFLECPEIKTPVTLPDREPAWHLYVIRLNLDRLKTSREVIFRALRAENIGVNVHYIPVPWHSYYQRLGYVKGNWPVAERAYETLISLPIFPAMTDRDGQNVICAVKKVIGHFRI